MGTQKVYTDVKFYEEKLKKVMARLGVENFDYDWTRTTANVTFFYKNQWYRFDHSVEKANALGKVKLVYGTDVFAQIVLALEDLARMAERGIYELGVWISGMKYLPEVKEIPQCFKEMGFLGTELPSREDLEARYKNQLKKVHPDNGGNTEDFLKLQDTMKRCLDNY